MYPMISLARISNFFLHIGINMSGVIDGTAFIARMTVDEQRLFLSRQEEFNDILSSEMNPEQKKARYESLIGNVYSDFAKGSSDLYKKMMQSIIDLCYLQITSVMKGGRRTRRKRIHRKRIHRKRTHRKH